MHRPTSAPSAARLHRAGLLTTVFPEPTTVPSESKSSRSPHGIKKHKAASECGGLHGHMQRCLEHGNVPPSHSLCSGGSVGAAKLARLLACHERSSVSRPDSGFISPCFGQQESIGACVPD